MKKKNYLYLYFIILPYIDLITSLLTRFTDLKISLGMIIKGLTLLFITIYTYFITKSSHKKKSIIYLTSLFLTIIIYLIFKIPNINNASALFLEVTNLLRYMYFPIMLVGLFNIFEDFDFNHHDIKKILLINCFSYTLLTIIPFITGTSFSSYNYSTLKENGFNGWFYAANETGAIMIILLTSISSLLKTKNYAIFIYILTVLIGIALLGTKVSLFGMIIVCLLIGLLYLFKNKGKHLIILPLLLFCVIIASLCSKTMTTLNNTIDNVSQTPNEVSSNIHQLTENQQLIKIMRIALNGRESFFVDNYQSFEKGDITTKLFGLGWNDNSQIDYTFEKKLIEIDFLDILFHYGIVIFIIYFLPIILIIIYGLKSIIKNIKQKNLNYEIIFYFLVMLLELFVSSFAGHVFAAPAVSIYLIFVIYNIYNIPVVSSLKERKITILALHLGTGGIEKYLQSLCKMLGDNYDIEIISTYKVAPVPAFPFAKNIPIKYLINCGPPREEFKKSIASKDLINILRYGFKSLRILFLKYWCNYTVVPTIDSKYIITTRTFHNKIVSMQKKSHQIAIATEHNYQFEKNRYVKSLVNSCHNINYLILVSEELRDFYQPLIKNTTCLYIPNTIDNVPDYQEHKKIKNHLVSIGRLSPEKGFDDLIDIINLIKKDIPSIKLDIYGDGLERETLANKITQLKLNNNITLKPFAKHNELMNNLYNYDVYLMTSHTESFGLVLVEAMSHSLPCIAFDSANGANILLSDDNGILVSKRDKTKYANEVVKLLKNLSNLNEISLKGYNKSKLYDLNNVQKLWLGLLESEDKNAYQEKKKN